LLLQVNECFVAAVCSTKLMSDDVCCFEQLLTFSFKHDQSGLAS